MILASLDVAKTTGWAVGCISNERPTTGVWPLPEKDKLDVVGARIAALENTLGSWLDRWKPAMVVTAEPFPTRNMGEAEAMAGLRGAVRNECWRRGIEFCWQPESTVRAQTLGKGRADTATMKRLVMAWCQKMGIDAATHDAGDAAVLWTWTRGELLRRDKNTLLPKPTGRRSVI